MPAIERLRFLCRVTERESLHLQQTSQRLFVPDFSVEWVRQLDTNLELGERVEAFVGRQLVCHARPAQPDGA